MEELKPCPFCGGEAKLKHGFPGEQRLHSRKAFVQCTICRAKSRTFEQVKFEAWQDTDKSAIEAWNRRAENG